METVFEVSHTTRVLVHRQKRRPAIASVTSVASKGSQSSSKMAKKFVMESVPSFTEYEWKASAAEEHPFINVIRQAIERYRLQSAAHYDVDIDVHQSDYKDNPDKQKPLSPTFKVRVGFHNFGCGPIERMCGPGSLRKRRKGLRIMTNDLVVYEKNERIPLEQFLESQFPLLEAPVRSEVLYKWWRENDKMFYWKDLPTELKEHIIQYCLHDSPLLATLSTTTASPRMRSKKSKPVYKAQHRGPYEVMKNFDKTSSLLRVSHQVRAITLRLCLQGGTGNSRREGLCIEVTRGLALKECIRRLGKSYQMSHADGVPVDEKTKALAKLYKLYPRIYPQLDQYATFAHGIRKVHLHMDYHTYFRFFKLTVGGLMGYWPRFLSSYELFEQLPALNEIVIDLPDAWGRMSDLSPRMMPPLFYPGFECPRILHRFIYEQVAEVLAIYPNVKMLGFVDDLEERRFDTLLSAAIQGLKFTSADLADLYKDDGGGIELDDPVYPDESAHGLEDNFEATRNALMDLDDYEFWPPKCRCAVACRKVLYPDQ